MSTTAIAWILMTAGLTLASLGRAAYGFSLYLFTFFLFPALWWWGRPLPNLRWNLFAGVVFLVAVALQNVREPLQGPADPRTTRIGHLLIAIVVNATLVHLLLAPSWAISLDNYVRMLKFAALFFLIVATIRNPRDFRLVLWSIVLGAAYIGYEVTFNDRGNFVRGRLEGVGAAGVNDANQLASLMATILPLAGGLFFSGSRRDKLLVAITGPLILNVVLLCSSRGALLALIMAGISFVVLATGAARKQAVYGLGLAGLTLFLLAADPDILARFMTTFTSAEERDDSAGARLQYWGAGVSMLADHPLGAGGDGFKQAYASEYLAEEGIDAWARSVHNGILNEALEWGLQGWVLRMLFIGLAVVLTKKTLRHQAALGRSADAALGCCLVASTVAFLCSGVFGDYMDDEWGYWIPALMVAYSRLYGSTVDVTAEARVAPTQVAPRRAAALPRPAVSGRTGTAVQPERGTPRSVAWASFPDENG